MDTAVVILNWNGRSMLRRFLPKVLECTPNASVIVADNASTDGSVSMLHEQFAGVGVIELDRNYGFAEGYNQALKHVDAKYYMLLNSDVEVCDGWLEPLVGFLDANDGYCSCQPKLLSWHDRDSFEYAGACGGYIDKYGYPFCRGRIFGTVEHDDGQYDTVRDVLWTTGACMLIRSDDFWHAGGFDGRFFAHNEEIDLCWRLRLMGRRLACVPQSKVWHIGGGTLPKGNPMKTYLNFRNNLTMVYKNTDDDKLAHVMRVRRVLDYIAAAQMALKCDWDDFKAVLKARRDFSRWMADFAPQRTEIQRRRVVDEIEEVYDRSLILDYYMRGRRRFSQLPVAVDA